MEHEGNRLDSFSHDWFLPKVESTDLAACGFLKLNSMKPEVECAFCHVVIKDWNFNQTILKQHIKLSPNCPFIMRKRVPPKFPDYKPRYPRMVDLKKRLSSYGDWPILSQSCNRMAECGLYYTSVIDYVDFFFYGGRTGGWEPNDDPVQEHVRFYPRYGYLSLIERHGSLPTKIPLLKLIAEASRIFTKLLVEQALSETSRPIEELCGIVLEYLECFPKSNESNKEAIKKICKNTNDQSDVLLCKICMDRYMSTVFQPCGHVVACLKCSNVISICPLCRTPITSQVKIYFG